MFCPQCGTRAAEEHATCTLCGAALPGRAAPPVTVAARMPVHEQEPPRYGGFWRRLAGVLLDAIVLYFPAATVRVLLGLPAMNSFNTIDADPSTAMVASSLELFLDWLYVAALVASPARATLGMMVMDLQLTRTDGRRVTFSRATWRYFAQFLSLLTVGIGYLIQPFTPRRQTLHDLVSGTVVIRPRREPALAADVRLAS